MMKISQFLLIIDIAIFGCYRLDAQVVDAGGCAICFIPSGPARPVSAQ